jgi:hypothetical protein
MIIKMNIRIDSTRKGKNMLPIIMNRDVITQEEKIIITKLKITDIKPEIHSAIIKGIMTTKTIGMTEDTTFKDNQQIGKSIRTKLVSMRIEITTITDSINMNQEIIQVQTSVLNRSNTEI